MCHSKRLTRIICTTALVIAVLALALPAFAGPIADYEAAFRTAYADYRSALFATNTNNRPASDKTVAAFEQKWSALAAKHRASPPPHYAEDPKWAATLDEVSGILVRAKAEIAKGDLAEAHETLESMRDVFAALRARNGVIAYSDRIDAFHHSMEEIGTKPYGGFTGAGLTELIEDAAILAHLGAELKKSPPPDALQSPEFAPLLDAVLKSVADLQAAAHAGDLDKIKAARARIKPAFAKLFVKFG
jgi:hypothetical protein